MLEVFYSVSSQLHPPSPLPVSATRGRAFGLTEYDVLGGILEANAECLW